MKKLFLMIISFLMFNLLFSEEVKYDLSLGADPNCVYSQGDLTALMAALLYTPDLFEYGKYYRTILILLDAGADVNQPDGTGRTPLLEAVRVEDIQVARELLKRGAIVSAEDQNGLTPVIHAISRGNKRMVKMLVEKEPATAHLATKTGDTPLMFAVAGGYKKIVKYLVLERYVDVKAKNNQGKTAYTFAVEKGHRAIAEFLAQQEQRCF